MLQTVRIGSVVVVIVDCETETRAKLLQEWCEDKLTDSFQESNYSEGSEEE